MLRYFQVTGADLLVVPEKRGDSDDSDDSDDSAAAAAAAGRVGPAAGPAAGRGDEPEEEATTDA